MRWATAPLRGYPHMDSNRLHRLAQKYGDGAGLPPKPVKQVCVEPAGIPFLPIEKQIGSSIGHSADESLKHQQKDLLTGVTTAAPTLSTLALLKAETALREDDGQDSFHSDASTILAEDEPTTCRPAFDTISYRPSLEPNSTRKNDQAPTFQADVRGLQCTPLPGDATLPDSAPPSIESLVADIVADVTPQIDEQAAWLLRSLTPSHGSSPSAAQCSNVLETSYRLYCGDYPRVALRLLQQLLAQMEPSKAEALAADPRAAKVLPIGFELAQLVDDLLGTESWKVCGTYRNLKGEPWAHAYVREAENNRLDVKVEGVLQRPLKHICASLLELDLLHKWLPGVGKSQHLDTLSNFRHACYVRMDLPWPLAKRDAFLVGYGDVYDERSVIVYLRNCRDDELVAERADLDAQSKKAGYVRMDMSGGFILQAISPTQTRVKMIMRYDVKLKVLPPALQDFLTKKLAAFFLPMLSAHARKFEAGGKYASVPDRRPETYGELDRRLAGVMAGAANVGESGVTVAAE